MSKYTEIDLTTMPFEDIVAHDAEFYAGFVTYWLERTDTEFLKDKAHKLGVVVTCAAAYYGNESPHVTIEWEWRGREDVARDETEQECYRQIVSTVLTWQRLTGEGKDKGE